MALENGETTCRFTPSQHSWYRRCRG